MADYTALGYIFHNDRWYYRDGTPVNSLRPTMTSSGSLSLPQVGDIWTIVTAPGVEYSDLSMMQDRGAGYVTLTLGTPSATQHTVVSADIPPVGTQWPVVVRDLSINLVSNPILTGTTTTNPPVTVDYLRFYTENAHGTVANPAMVAFGNNNRVSASIHNRSNWPVQTAAQAFGPNSNLNPFLGTYDELPPGKKNTYTTEKGFVWLRCKRLANTSITVSGNVATVVFAAPIAAPVTISPGDLVVFESVTPAGFNTTWPVASVVDTSTITIDVTGKGLSTATVAGNYFGRANRGLFVELKEQR